MRVLLDEDLPLGLAKHLTQHETRHVAQMGWKGKSNGELLRLAVAERFDVLLTGDAHLRYQQDLRGHDIAVIELRPGRLVLKRLLERGGLPRHAAPLTRRHASTEGVIFDRDLPR